MAHWKASLEDAVLWSFSATQQSWPDTACRSVSHQTCYTALFWGLWRKSGTEAVIQSTGLLSGLCAAQGGQRGMDVLCTWTVLVTELQLALAFLWVFRWLCFCLFSSFAGQGRLPLGLTNENSEKQTKDSFLSLFPFPSSVLCFSENGEAPLPSPPRITSFSVVVLFVFYR